MSDQVDLSDLNFTPDWLKESGKTPEPREYRDDERPGRGKGGKGGKGKSARGGGQGKRGGGGGFRDDDRRSGGGGFKGKGKGGGRDDRGGGGRGGFKGRGKGGGHGGDRDRRPPAPPKPPPGIVAELHPGGPGVKQIAEQIKKTARAYSVFDIARAVVGGRERYSIHFKRDKPDAPELFTCKADGSAWLTRSEALAHLPSTPAFAEHYDEEIVEGEAPTGNYTAIAVCGFSGKLIGPPNHHTYQTTIAKLHRDKFSNMSLDRYKQRIRIERDEETIEKWKAEQSVQKHYTYKKAAEGEEPPKFTARDAAERHFVENHADEYVASADEVAVSGNIPGRALSPGLLTALKGVAENARKHPASLVQPLCGMLGSEGLKFFKRGRKIFACLTRPKPLTDDSGLSAPIRAIVEHLRATKKATVETILEALAPGEPPAAKQEPKPEAAPEPAPAKTTKAHTLWMPRAPELEEAKPAENEAPAAPSLTPAQIRVLQDLRWLLYEGAAIAFGDGHIELATPKPANEGQQKQAKKKAPKKKIPIPGQPPKPIPLGAHTLWIPPGRASKPASKSKKPKGQPTPTPAASPKAIEIKEPPKPAPTSRAHTLWIK